MMREPSMLVRETAAEQLEVRRNDWAYSRPVVVLDLIWNVAFVMVAIVVLGLSNKERPNTPLRWWLIGYALQSVLHMLCVCLEYRRRRQQHARVAHGSSHSSSSSTMLQDFETSREDVSDESESSLEHTSLVKRLESANAMVSFVWWIVGFYWITAGGQALTHDAPRLYWLCVVFLAFDVFFVVFCVALVCIIGLAVCCCLPCIIAVLYAVADEDGASEEDISALKRDKFRRAGSFDENRQEKIGPFGGAMTLVDHSETPKERWLSAEDAECCICLASYVEGVELRELPCSHHFHCECVDKWLCSNATCPLCKYIILKSSSTAREEA